MSNCEQKEPVAADVSPALPATDTVVAGHDGADAMSTRSMTVSRRERFEAVERAALKALPVNGVDCGEWRQATLHPDCYVLVEAVLYSALHIHRHKKLRIKLTANHVEIFLNLERLAIHPRSRHRDGRRIKIDAHFPPRHKRITKRRPNGCCRSPGSSIPN